MVEVCGCGDGGLVLRPNGPLSLEALEPLEKAFAAALDVGGSEIRIDLANVTVLTGTAVGFFLRAAALCGECRVRFALVNVEGLNLVVLGLLDATHLVESAREDAVSLGGG